MSHHRVTGRGRRRDGPGGSLTGAQQVAGTVEGPASSALDGDRERETQTGRKGGGQPRGSRVPAATPPRVGQEGSLNPRIASAEIGGFLKHGTSGCVGSFKRHRCKPSPYRHKSRHTHMHTHATTHTCITGWLQPRCRVPLTLPRLTLIVGLLCAGIRPKQDWIHDSGGPVQCETWGPPAQTRLRVL